MEYTKQQLKEEKLRYDAFLDSQAEHKEEAQAEEYELAILESEYNDLLYDEELELNNEVENG